MAEYADEAINRMLFGHSRRTYQRRLAQDRIAKCDHCGSTDVYWSQNENGDWRLYEEGKRIQPGNRKMLHSCSQAELDDFDVVE